MELLFKDNCLSLGDALEMFQQIEADQYENAYQQYMARLENQ